MKTIGRVLIILTAFSIVSWLLAIGVNASGANTPNIAGNTQLRPSGDNNRLQAEGNRSDRRHEGGNGLGLVMGAVKNIFVISFLVIIIVWSKSAAKKKKRTPEVISVNSES